MKVKTLFSKITHLPSIGLLQVCLGIFIDMRVAVDLAIRKESFKYQVSFLLLFSPLFPRTEEKSKVIMSIMSDAVYVSLNS